MARGWRAVQAAARAHPTLAAAGVGAGLGVLLVALGTEPGLLAVAHAAGGTLEQPVVAAALIGGVVAVTSAVLVRRTGREATHASRETAELAAITARLETELDALRGLNTIYDTTLKATIARVDGLTVQADALAADAAQCHHDLDAVRAELAALRGAP